MFIGSWTVCVCKGEHVERDITRKDSVVIMDAWDSAGRLYYESHPLLLPSRALNILMHNLSKL